MNHVTAILSMLHEGAEPNSATRLFRGEPVLGWTLQRISRASGISSISILCWEDQLEATARLAARADAFVLAKGPRVSLPQLEAISISRRWSDGWRCGLLSTCDFDLGFYGPWISELSERVQSEGVVLVDPAAALVDPMLLDGLVDHAAEHPDVPMCFSPAAPGLGGALLKQPLLEQLAATKLHAGRLLHYVPDQVSREPLAGDWCAPVPTAVARTTHHFKLDSNRQIERLSAATTSLNGELISSPAEQIVQKMNAAQALDPLPREVVLELNTSRSTNPVFWSGARLKIDRPEFSLEIARRLFDEMATLDDTRLTLAGIGDPLLYEPLFELIKLAKERAALSIHLETDLLNVPAGAIQTLADAPIDVLSVVLPALRPETYEQVMGTAGYERVLENVRAFLAARKDRGVPILVPTFVKCRLNQNEMEAWYDQWLRAVGCAVIRGPSDFGGLIADVAVADMSPPRRKACNRLASRVTILSDGRIVSCEEDVLGRQVLGQIGRDSLREAWQKGMSAMRASHAKSQWAHNPTCINCREWHRP